MRRTGSLIALAVALLGARIGYSLDAPDAGRSEATAAPVSREAPPAILTPKQIAERALPSIVLIRTPSGLGSGFVVRADGRIATNLHVIEDAAEATVVLPDSREVPATSLVAIDRTHDLAVLQVDATGLVPLKLGDSDQAKPGEAIVAIGHPLGFGNTVSNGLVSAVRDIAPGLKLLQISAPISPGSSGGPLIDEAGNVIGTSTLVTTEGQNLNFGMPINYLKPLVDATGSLPLSAAAGPSHPRRKVRREIPNHDLTLLDGCTDDDLRKIRDAIGEAIDVGAPLYNEGNASACYRIYEGTALDLQRRMKSCPGPRHALLDGVKKAAKTSDASARAWRMRDAFDGVIDVIERKLGASEGGSGRDLRQRRVVPVHDVSVLKGCSTGEVALVGKAISDAIDLGAPLYREGKVSACFRIYQSASLEMVNKLQCKGLAAALRSGLDRAAAANTDDERAWALRDAFDGIVDVITRARTEAH
jgi:hypothetical protein